MASFIQPAIGAGLSIFDYFQQLNAAHWAQAAEIEKLNNARALQDKGLGAFHGAYDPSREKSLQINDLLMALTGGNEGMAAQLNDLIMQTPGLADQLFGAGSDPFGRGMNPAGAEYQGNLAGNLTGLQGGQNLAMQGFQGGGWTPGAEYSQDRFSDMMNGQGAAMGGLQDTGTRLFGSEGGNNWTNSTQDRAVDAINRGGMNDQLQAAWASSGALLNPQGRTSNLDALQSLGSGMFAAQGFNPQNSALAARGADLAGREALMSPAEMFQFSREDAARAIMGAQKKALRDSLARGGKAAGVVRAGGAESDPMSEWADAAGRAVSDAGRKALIDRQGLGLQQMATGAGMSNAALSNALGYGNLGSQTSLGGQQQETQRFLQALGLLPEISNSAATQMNSYNSGASGGAGAALGRASLGANAMNMYNNAKIGAGNLYNTSLGNQNTYATNLGSLANNFGQTYNAGQNALFGNNLNSGKFGADLNNQQFAGQTTGVTQYQQFLNSLLTGMAQSNSNLTDLAGKGTSLVGASLGVPINSTAGAPPSLGGIASAVSKAPSFSGTVNISGSGGGSPDLSQPGYDPKWHGG